MTYYLDKEFRLHATDDGTRSAWEDVDGLFDGKCQTYIEGYRVVPAGQHWTRSDGVVFCGPMIAPNQPWGDLDVSQRKHERLEIENMRAALALLGVNADECKQMD